MVCKVCVHTKAELVQVDTERERQKATVAEEEEEEEEERRQQGRSVTTNHVGYLSRQNGSGVGHGFASSLKRQKT